ncbi:MAG: hypothetical protein M1820_001665 [Bogoriella megaspora]|nr:MAG: hypothetical protein M1820_001665 [Bogoriella megaspora]
MLIIGLTGSIATGKSTVSNLLRSPPYSLPVIDADVLARKVVEPGTAGYKAVLLHFSATTPDLLQTAEECGGENGPDGKGRPLNRPALGKRVFGDSEERQRDRKVLNGIVHPEVRREMYRLMAWYYFTGHWAVVLDIPLLFESGWERFCGCIIVVAVSDPVVQMNRLRERDPHLSEEDARNRVGSQTDVREKAKRVGARGKGWGEVVWNDGSKEDTRREVDRVIAEIKERSPRWWSWLMLFPPAGTTAALWSFLTSWRMQKAWTDAKLREKAKL